jgi:hypothetical protein
MAVPDIWLVGGIERAEGGEHYRNFRKHMTGCGKGTKYYIYAFETVLWASH